jgi:hypothetical protein
MISPSVTPASPPYRPGMIGLYLGDDLVLLIAVSPTPLAMKE